MTRGDGELPKGWASSTVGEVAEVQLGRQRSPQHHAGDQMRPYLRSANIGWAGLKLDDVNEMNFDDKDFETYRLLPGDLLLNEASGSPSEVGKPAIWNGEIDDCCFQNTLLRVKPWGVSSPYLYWYCYCAALSGRFGEAGRGVNIRHLGKQGLARFPVSLPPLAEQERVVAAIDEHLSRLDAAEAALNATERKLVLLLRATLASACSGDWPRRQLAEIVTSLRNGVFVSRPAAEPPGLPIYRISAVRPLMLRVDDVRYADPEPTNAESYAVEAGDLLFTRYSGNPDFVGAAAVVPPAGAGVLHPDKLIRVVADRGQALPDWIAAYVTAGEGRSEIEKRLKTTAGQVGISGSQLKTVPIPVPPIDHQTEMVAMIATVRAEQVRLAGEVHSAANHGSALRRSILAGAFSGRLVAQDPSDESADVLLARMTEERSSAGTRGRAKAKSTTRVTESSS